MPEMRHRPLPIPRPPLPDTRRADAPVPTSLGCRPGLRIPARRQRKHATHRVICWEPGAYRQSDQKRSHGRGRPFYLVRDVPGEIQDCPQVYRGRIDPELRADGGCPPIQSGH